METNPGPSPDEVLAFVLEIVQRIESGQDAIRNDFKDLKLWQEQVDIERKKLSSRLRSVEVDVSEPKKQPFFTVR